MPSILVPYGTNGRNSMVPFVYQGKRFLVRKAKSGCAQPQDGDRPLRERILNAAFAAFMEHGYAGASTLEIATRARVSKRELYALVGNKQAMLAACIAGRARRMRLPLELPPARDRDALVRKLATFGAAILRELYSPGVIAVYRLAITEAKSSPEVSQSLDVARRTNFEALTEVLRESQSFGLIGGGDVGVMAEQFLALLRGDHHISMLLGLADALDAAAIDRRARAATEALLVLYAAPKLVGDA